MVNEVGIRACDEAKTLLRSWVEANKKVLYDCSSFHLAAKLAEVTEQLCGGDAEEAKVQMYIEMESTLTTLTAEHAAQLARLQKHAQKLPKVVGHAKQLAGRTA